MLRCRCVNAYGCSRPRCPSVRVPSSSSSSTLQGPMPVDSSRSERHEPNQAETNNSKQSCGNCRHEASLFRQSSSSSHFASNHHLSLQPSPLSDSRSFCLKFPTAYVCHLLYLARRNSPGLRAVLSLYSGLEGKLVARTA